MFTGMFDKLKLKREKWTKWIINIYILGIFINISLVVKAKYLFILLATSSHIIHIIQKVLQFFQSNSEYIFDMLSCSSTFIFERQEHF